MRRNWDVVRHVLFLVEEGAFRRHVDDVAVDHFWVLRDAGLLRNGESGPDFTAAGRDFLAAIRDDRVWAVCRRAIALNAGGMPSDLLLSTARDAILELTHRAARDCGCEPGVCKQNRACPRLPASAPER